MEKLELGEMTCREVCCVLLCVAPCRRARCDGEGATRDLAGARLSRPPVKDCPALAVTPCCVRTL